MRKALRDIGGALLLGLVMSAGPLLVSLLNLINQR